MPGALVLALLGDSNKATGKQNLYKSKTLGASQFIVVGTIHIDLPPYVGPAVMRVVHNNSPCLEQAGCVAIGFTERDCSVGHHSKE